MNASLDTVLQAARAHANGHENAVNILKACEVIRDCFRAADLGACDPADYDRLMREYQQEDLASGRAERAERCVAATNPGTVTSARPAGEFVATMTITITMNQWAEMCAAIGYATGALKGVTHWPIPAELQFKIASVVDRLETIELNIVNATKPINGTYDQERERFLALEADDASAEESPAVQPRRGYRCADGMCGADDCSRCGDGGGD